MAQTCIEIVVYKVKNAQLAEAARRAVKLHVEAFPGFISWQATVSAEDPLLFTDIVTWMGLEYARDAGAKVISDPECQPFMAEIDAIVSSGHYV